MASFGFEPSFDIEADRESLKMMRASTRATSLHIKRAERARARDARDWTWGKGIEGAKPHHAIRVAARTCLAKGLVETQADMPALVHMSSTEMTSLRRKPAIAHIVQNGKDVDDKAFGDVDSDLHDAETTASEGESSQTSLAFASQDLPSEPETEPAALDEGWPALPLAAVHAPAVADAPRPSHRDVAVSFIEASLEEQAAADRFRAKQAAAARARQEASMWKASWSRRRKRLLAAKRAQKQPSVGSATEQACGDLPQGTFPATASSDFEAHLDVVKMARAAARHRSLHLKRVELARARGTRDWTWGKGIEGARPHHAARAAARTGLAKGTVESQEDMPSIVRMGKPGDKSTRRKPAIAHMVQNAQDVDDKAFGDVDFDLHDAETTASEGSDSFETETSQTSRAFAAQDLPSEPETNQADFNEEWPALPLAVVHAV